MMTVNIEDALNKTPFVPFDIHIDSGKTVHVRHPDFLLFSESKRMVVVVDGKHFHIVDVEHISSLSAAMK
jgi:hypothetical protein